MGDISENISILQTRLGYEFRSSKHLHEALTHASYLQGGNDTISHNQRLEFLGDSVLHFALTDELYRIYPQEREGVLSRRRAVLCKGGFLSQLATELGIGSSLLLSKSELEANGRRRPSILEDALEAVVGAIYLDSDIATVQHIVLRWYGPIADRLAALEGSENPKGRLQELVQPKYGNSALRYEVIEATGPRHAREYRVAVFLNDRNLGEGCGTSKKSAEENAARASLASLGKNELK